MRLAAGRLRVSYRFSFSASWKSRDEILHEKARAFAKQKVESIYRECSEHGYDWQWHSRVNSRTALHLAERKAVLDVLDGRGRWGGQPIPRWRWHKRQMLERELLSRNRIEKWW